VAGEGKSVDAEDRHRSLPIVVEGGICFFWCGFFYFNFFFYLSYFVISFLFFILFILFFIFFHFIFYFYFYFLTPTGSRVESRALIHYKYNTLLLYIVQYTGIKYVHKMLMLYVRTFLCVGL
jgi:hypothetical protein